MAAVREYERLPGRTAGFSRHSLWLGPDHLLSIANRGYSEDYKRFYYRDIRALLLRKTAAYPVIGSIYCVLVAVFLLLHILGFLLWKWEDPHHIVLGMFTAFFVFLLLVHLLRGPTCSVNIFTAVHSEPLPSLHRTRVAVRAIGLLRSRVEAVQGMITREQLLASAGVLVAPSLLYERSSAVAEQKLDDYRGNFHASLFALLLFNAVLTLVACFIRNLPLNLAGAFVFIALVLFLIGALIRQRKSRMGTALRKMTWISAVYIWLVSVLNSFIAVYLMFQGGVVPGKYGYWDLMKSVFTTVPADHLPLLIVEIIVATGSLALGVVGFILLFQYRREHS